KKGYQLSLSRLEDALRSYGVQEIICQGRPFDPRSMEAVDVEERDDVREGRVLEVYQRGYQWNGDVFRTARVKVSRRTGTADGPAGDRGEAA
ncbi:MAG: nucleotide exchange factor GrpE, partial [Proteobacteria bacterium]|nr:nucleotide exchange factor GrpE [Pseudomonadota bacterium]